MTPRNLEPDWWLDARAVARCLWAVALPGVLFMGAWMASEVGREWR